MCNKQLRWLSLVLCPGEGSDSLFTSITNCNVILTLSLKIFHKQLFNEVCIHISCKYSALLKAVLQSACKAWMFLDGSVIDL